MIFFLITHIAQPVSAVWRRRCRRRHLALVNHDAFADELGWIILVRHKRGSFGGEACSRASDNRLRDPIENGPVEWPQCVELARSHSIGKRPQFARRRRPESTFSGHLGSRLRILDRLCARGLFRSGRHRRRAQTGRSEGGLGGPFGPRRASTYALASIANNAAIGHIREERPFSGVTVDKRTEWLRHTLLGPWRPAGSTTVG